MYLFVYAPLNYKMQIISETWQRTLLAKALLAQPLPPGAAHKDPIEAVCHLPIRPAWIF